MSCALILLTWPYGWDSMADIDINPSSMGLKFRVWIGPTIGVPKWAIRIGPQLFDSSAVEWYVMCLDSLNWTLWVRFYGRYWYQSFLDGSNSWGVHWTDPWGPEMDHPPLGRSYLVVLPSYDMSCAFYFLNEILLVRFHGWYWYQSFIDGSNFLGVDRTDFWGTEMDYPP